VPHDLFASQPLADGAQAPCGHRLPISNPGSWGTGFCMYLIPKEIKSLNARKFPFCVFAEHDVAMDGG
jgi:hypothetical protein